MKTNQYPSSVYISKITLIGILFFLWHHKVEAQVTEKNELSKKILYVDAGGHPETSTLVSLNLEARIHTGDKLSFYGRVGFGYAQVDFREGLGIPAAITMLTGKGNNHFEMTGGIFLGSVLLLKLDTVIKSLRVDLFLELKQGLLVLLELVLGMPFDQGNIEVNYC